LRTKRVGVVVLPRAGVSEDGREPDVEERVERRPVGRALEHAGGESLAQLLALHEVDGAEHARRVEHLGQRDADTGVAQGVEEPDLALDEAAVHEVSSASAARWRARGRWHA
jgi:hypothetical protein